MSIFLISSQVHSLSSFEESLRMTSEWERENNVCSYSSSLIIVYIIFFLLSNNLPIFSEWSGIWLIIVFSLNSSSNFSKACNRLKRSTGICIFFQKPNVIIFYLFLLGTEGLIHEFTKIPLRKTYQLFFLKKNNTF